MDIIEKLLERINLYNAKMQSEKNMPTKMSYLDELIKVANLTIELNFIMHNSILNVERALNVEIVGSTTQSNVLPNTQSSVLPNYFPPTR